MIDRLAPRAMDSRSASDPELAFALPLIHEHEPGPQSAVPSLSFYQMDACRRRRLAILPDCCAGHRTRWRSRWLGSVMGRRRKPSSADPADVAGRVTHVAGSSGPTEYRSHRFYDSDQSLARIVAEFLQEGFAIGSPAIVIATAGQRAEIARELTDRSFDVAALQRSRNLVLLDGEEVLSTFMVDGRPDARTFRDEIRRLIESVRCGRHNCAVRVFGQMVDVLWQQGRHDAAIRLELLWNQLALAEATSLVFGYAIGNFYKDARFEDICRRESHFASTDDKENRPRSTASDTRRRGSKRNARQ